MTLPAACDVAVVGGGIIGMSAAHALAERGVRVALFEKGLFGCEQSSRNWGWVRTLSRDPAEVPLAVRARELWRRVQARTDVGYRQTGMLYLARHARDLADYEAWRDRVAAFEPGAQMLDARAVAERIPVSRSPWAGAMYSAQDGVAEPSLATQGIARLAVESGAMLFEHCAVRGLDVAGGRVQGVITERGRVRAQAVILAGGAWSRIFCTNHDVAFPQLKVLGSVLRTTPIDTASVAAINGRDFTCRKRADGGYTVSQFDASIAEIVPDSFRLLRQFLPAWWQNNGLVKLRLGRRFLHELGVPRRFALDTASPFEACRVLDPQPRQSAVEQALARLRRSFPVFEQARVAQAWAGYIDVTPDALPVIGPIASIPGFFLASGFSGHGFGLGPAVGEALADLVQQKTPTPDLSPFAWERFGAS